MGGTQPTRIMGSQSWQSNCHQILAYLLYIDGVLSLRGLNAPIVEFAHSPQEQKTTPSGPSVPSCATTSLNDALASFKKQPYKQPYSNFGMGCCGFAAIVSMALLAAVALGSDYARQGSKQGNKQGKHDSSKCIKQRVSHVGPIQARPKAMRTVLLPSSENAGTKSENATAQVVDKIHKRHGMDFWSLNKSDRQKQCCTEDCESQKSARSTSMNPRNRQKIKHVRFADVDVRELNLLTGGGGAVASHGPPLGVGWDIVDEWSMSVLKYDTYRASTRIDKDEFIVEGRISEKARRRILLQAGATEAELRRSEHLCLRVHKRREESNAGLRMRAIQV